MKFDRQSIPSSLRHAAALVLAAFFLLAAAPVLAGGGDATRFQGEVDYLVQLLETGEAGFEAGRVGALLDWTSGFSGDPAKVDLPDLKTRDGKTLTDAFWSFSIKMPFAKLVRYIYDPAIPSCVLMPASLRQTGWQDRAAAARELAGFWERTPGEPAFFFRGVEDEQSTPDTHTGGYYKYAMQRLIGLFDHAGRKVLVSISRTKNPSVTGKKGVVLGDDGDWNYFYSGLNGVKLPIFGWSDVDSRIYESFSIFVIQPEGDGAARVSIFKWLRAGWKGMNVVSRKNILSGCERMSASFLQVMESPLLPGADEIADQAARLRELPDDVLRARAGALLPDMTRLAESHKVLRRKEFARIIEAGYLASQSREELESSLMKAYIRDKVLTPSIIQARKNGRSNAVN